VLAVATLVRGELHGLQWSHVSATSVLALAYLVVFGSLVAFSAYVWLLGNSTPALVSTYAYVNPVVAVLLGWMVLREPITPRVLLAAAVIIAAVAIITLGRKPDAKPAVEPPEPADAAPPVSVDRTIGPGEPRTAPSVPRTARTTSGNGRSVA
jgi:drug/metabolite transporter (DMT)-like permease